MRQNVQYLNIKGKDNDDWQFMWTRQCCHPFKRRIAWPKIKVYKEYEMCIWFVISDRESDSQSLQRRATVKGIATGFNRQSKLQGCSEVVISKRNGRNLSEQVTWLFYSLCCLYPAFVKHKCFKIFFVFSWLGNDHLTWSGGLWFFSKKVFWFPMLWKKILWFWWRKKNNLIRVFVI